MARIHSTGTHLPNEVSKTLTTLAELPTDWQVFVGWPDLDAIRPDLLVVSPSGHLVFVTATGAEEDILDIFDPEILPEPDAPLPERRLHRAITALRIKNLAGVPARSLLVLTNASWENLEFTFLPSLPQEILCANREDLSAEFFEQLVLGAQARPDLVDKARAHVSSASTIPPELTVGQIESKTQRVRFLDRLQEDWLRRQVAPSEDTERFARSTASGRYLLTGPAGCGKTLLLLYRAALESKLRPSTRPLVLTHNKPLLADLRAKSAVLAQQFQVRPFTAMQILSWCSKWARPWPSAVTYSKRDALVREAIGPNATPEEVRFHADEFAYIQDHIITEFDGDLGYKEFERRGRSRPLQPAQRDVIWKRLERYLALLDRDRVTDFPTFGLWMYQRVKAGDLTPPAHDMILVDEAQFLPPTLLGVLKETVGPDGTLILAADPTQGFLQRRSPWTQAGLNFSGRTTRLSQPYRSTKSILQFARAFYLARSKECDDPETNLPGAAELAASHEGPWPDIECVDRLQDEELAVVKMVSQLISAGTQGSNILVLTGERGGAQRLLCRLQAASTRASQQWDAAMAKESCRPEQVRVCTLDTATGLEAPYVIVCGLRGIFESESDPTLQEEQTQIIEDNTRRFYMAFTRAGFRLLIIWSGQTAHPFPSRPNAG